MKKMRPVSYTRGLLIRGNVLYFNLARWQASGVDLGKQPSENSKSRRLKIYRYTDDAQRQA